MSKFVINVNLCNLYEIFLHNFAMTFLKYLFFTCTSFVLCIGYGNGQRYSYEAPNIASNTRKELEVAGPIIENAVHLALNHVHSSYKNTSGHHGILKNLTRFFEIIYPYFDASGKLPAGLSRGNVNWLGSFDICEDIPARYCLFSFNISSQNQTLTIRLAACLPPSSPHNGTNKTVDLHEVFGNMIAENANRNQRGVNITFTGSACPVRPKYTTDVIVTIAFCGFLLFLCVLGTIVDVFEWNSFGTSPKSEHYIRAFSFLRFSVISLRPWHDRRCV
ncbi:uncharacterized protein LOC114517142 [Dendronephthya gigantea]|uniref:uncharacterized protein LOC114517142 n=1 Tax=Dendronephthya gigantea TaxID=151771 RepID=UPI0010697C99|nr:uncharacterized protein LOC114517142 [Dendronephthya gigantea]